jgi:murein DD-endopeptidase MepM/ murein hydrolase activator NlpD
MKKNIKIIIAVILAIILAIILYKNYYSFLLNLFISKPPVSIYPETIYPGDPIFITINASSTPKKISLDNKVIPSFYFDGANNALFPTDFYEKKLQHKVSVELNNGMIINKDIILTTREKIEKPLGIPEKLGGNTPQAGKALVNNLANENYILNNIQSSAKIIWKQPFAKPLQNLFITDTYGYDRKTVGYTIVHKGTDFRAEIGTPVYAMNDGIVRIARGFTVYGNVIAIDHGQGLITLYMHLSKINVKQGDIVKIGENIGESGQTGYVSAPHLHISIKINGISIDPATFMKFFKII